MFTKKILFVHKICNNDPGAIKTYIIYFATKRPITARSIILK